MNTFRSIVAGAATADAAGRGAGSPLRDRPRRDGARELRCLWCAVPITARHGRPPFSTYRRMRAAECRSRKPRIA